ncbi:MAG: DUF1254 domain-containing protein [Hyphomicrobiales bacterium]|nr:DUF1254 domain-containing protein [Hyphomicrobiales bacterium]
MSRLAIACGAVFALAAWGAGAAYAVLTPRLIFWRLESRATHCQTASAICAPPGQFIHKRALATPHDRAVVNPNADTLYSSAFLDLGAGPWVLHVPAMGARYYAFQFMDAKTDVFGYASRRTMGGKPGDYLIAGPSWKGAAPDGMPVFRSDTNAVWVLARVLVDGPQDTAAVAALQDQFSLKPLP